MAWFIAVFRYCRFFHLKQVQMPGCFYILSQWFNLCVLYTLFCTHKECYILLRPSVPSHHFTDLNLCEKFLAKIWTVFILSFDSSLLILCDVLLLNINVATPVSLPSWVAALLLWYVAWSFLQLFYPNTLFRCWISSVTLSLFPCLFTFDECSQNCMLLWNDLAWK